MNSRLLIIIAAVLILIGAAFFIFGGSGEGEKKAVEDSGQTQEKASQEPNNPKNYVGYSSDSYEKAKEEGKVVMLYFTANWCPTCQAQEPVNIKAFEELKEDSDIVIFKIHILDSETTDEAEELAEEFKVRLQHTYVIIDPAGEVVFTHTGPLIKDDIIKNLLAAKN